MKKQFLFCLFFCSMVSVHIYGQSLSDFPWLSSVIDEQNCCLNNQVNLMESASGTEYIMVMKDAACAGMGGTLYTADGQVWCTTTSSFNCVAHYGLSLKATLFDCGQGSQFDFFGTFPWLTSIVDETNCCNNDAIMVYRDANNHQFVRITADPSCSSSINRWYYQTGELFCADGIGISCIEAYGFSEMEVLATWQCGDNTGVEGLETFTVTIENVMEEREFFTSGTIGFIAPENSESYTFNAAPGHYLNFATMFVQSNDLFLGPISDVGIRLYDDNGNPQTGDVTALVDYWDAGTEVNEMPGTGPNQAPRQSGPNTGVTENGVVRLLDDNFTYPAVSEIAAITLTHDGGTQFTLTISNISQGSSLPSPLAPGVWVINSAGQTALFASGETASLGLEALAEDGNNEMMNNNIDGRSGFVSPFAPGAFGINAPVFTRGQRATPALEALAEDGSPAGFKNHFAVPVGGTDPAPLFPGQSYSFSFMAKDGDVLSFATMLVQSNDWFLGSAGISLFENGQAISGDVTAQSNLYDAGTEVDEFAGTGLNQAPRQSGPNTGAAENGLVIPENEPGAHVPSVDNIIRIMISR